MCLVAFAFKAHPAYRLILAANRDEFHGRPASALHWWPDEPGGILAGRDLEAGGTWLGVSSSGRFATVTNYREELDQENHYRSRKEHVTQLSRTEHVTQVSRGALVTQFVTTHEPALSWSRQIDLGAFRGVNLLAAAGDELVYVSNRGDEARLLTPGVYGLSNASLDTPWEKVTRSKAALLALTRNDVIQPERLFDMLGDRTPAASDDYSGSGVPPGLARAVSAPFISTEKYGTRCSTVLLMGCNGRLEILERRFDSAGKLAGESAFEFTVD